MDSQQEHAYVNTAANDDGIKPPTIRKKALSKPAAQNMQKSSKPRQAEDVTQKKATYSLSQNEMLLLILISSVVAIVVSMVIMGIVIGVVIMPKINDHGKGISCRGTFFHD